MQAVKVRCYGRKNLSLGELVPLQKDLKRLSGDNFDKLKKSLLQYGFCFPFLVWFHEGVHYFIDGHQRDEVLRAMAEQPERYHLPKKFPVAFVEAKDRTEAAELILLHSSQYGQITELGFESFVSEYDLNLAQLEPLNLNHLDFKIKLPVAPVNQEGAFPVVQANEEIEEGEKAYHPQYAVAVVCKNETEQQAVFNSLQRLGYTNLKVLAI